MDGKLPDAQQPISGDKELHGLPSLDAGFRHPCRNDGTQAPVNNHDRRNLVNSPARQLAETVKDLEKRGLLQYDGQTKRWDLHPVVRGVAAGKLNSEEIQHYGQRVVDHFSQKSHSPYEEAEKLEDVQDGLHVVSTLLRMGHLQQAYDVYRGDLSNALSFNLEAHAEILSLLRPFFPSGWASLPEGLDEDGAAYLVNDAAIALDECGDQRASLSAFGTSLMSDLRHSNWPRLNTIQRNISVTLYNGNCLARDERCLRLALALAEVAEVKESLFMARLFRFHQLTTLGQWQAAEALWAILDPMGRGWYRAVYRPGQAEFNYVRLRYQRRDLLEEMLQQAERLAHTGKNRLSLRRLHSLRGAWHLDQHKWKLAADSLHEAVRMAREVRQTDAEAETGLALAKFHLGQLAEPRHAAEQLAKLKNPAHLALAELWLAIGEQEPAIHHALQAYRWAWADGEPYVHRFELNRATALLEKLGEPIPVLPPYDPAKDEKFPWEDEVAAAIEKLRAEEAG